MKANEKCLSLIRKWEGFHELLPNGNARAYPDPAHGWKVPTIGYGSTRNMDTGEAVQKGDVITRETAERWLRKEADECMDAMSKRYPACNENMIAALVSLTYNIGKDGIGDGLHSLLVGGKWQEAADKLLEYHHAEGDVDVEEGLMNRRKEERVLFLTPALAVQPIGVDERVTWLEYHRLDEGGVITTGVVAYAGADPLATWTGTSKAARDDFERRFKNVNNCPLVAPPNKPWPTLKPVENPKPRLVLKKVQPERLDPNGLYPMTLALMVGSEQKALFSARSGAPGRQVFQKGGSGELPGTLYPCPQGEYSVEDIQWAGGKDNYTASHGPGLGPVFVPFEPNFITNRGSFGIHLDENYQSAPGSAGCIVLRELQNVKNLVAVLREYDPKVLVVDWGL